MAHIRYQGYHITLKCNRVRADILCCIIMAMVGYYHSGAVLFGRYADELVNKIANCVCVRVCAFVCVCVCVCEYV